MKVYVIEKGYYSDRHIIGVVETEEEAIQICKVLKATSGYDADSTSYEEYDTKKFQTGQFRFIVEKYFNGHWQIEYDDYDLSAIYKENTCDFENHYIIYANSPQQALKIAQDMDAEIMAKKEGLI